MSVAFRVPTGALRELAEANGVCIRPVMHEVTDTVTGRRHLVPTSCGATLAATCPPCAQKNRVLRMQQCREGWHLDHEPQRSTAEDPVRPTEEDQATVESPDEEPSRRVRSTRHRQDVPDLPRVPMESRTVGKPFTAPSGRVYRPSMFVTFTLPSYGRVLPDGTPADLDRYDYRRAALDALHFPKLVDRLWQNLRRATGYQVQYFAVVEPQRRLAPHLHAALRGAIPRETFRQVVAATYHQVWWPAVREPMYTEPRLPLWDGHGYVDPATGVRLATWDEALDELDADESATPAHVLRFGRQLDIQGILADEDDADRRVAYLTKYLAKTFGQTYARDPGGGPSTETPRQQRHLERLHREVRLLPCSPRCANWLRFGIQPLDAQAGIRPGQCSSKAHDRDHLGCGGRRVLVSRRWTGKTLDGHRADRAAVVRKTLEAAGLEAGEVDRMAASVTRDDGRPRYEWKVWNAEQASTPLYRQVMIRAIAQRVRWRRDYDRAKAHSGPDPPPGNRTPDHSPLSPSRSAPPARSRGGGQG